MIPWSYEFLTGENYLGIPSDKLRGNEFAFDGEKASALAEKIDKEFNECMDDDFNTALVCAMQVQKTYALLGLFKKSAKEYVEWYDKKHAESIPAEVQAIANERFEARQMRDWAKSDLLRDKLAEMGYAVKDSKTGYELIKN